MLEEERAGLKRFLTHVFLCSDNHMHLTLEKVSAKVKDTLTCGIWKHFSHLLLCTSYNKMYPWIKQFWPSTEVLYSNGHGEGGLG